MKRKNIIAIDSGSGAIKFGFASFNEATGETESIDYTPDQSIKIKLAEDLETRALIKEIEDTGYIQDVYDKKNQPLNICEIFEPGKAVGVSYGANQSSVSARNYLESRYNNKFSSHIRKMYLEYITSVVKEIKEKYPDQDVEVHLVGTAALRKADDGRRLIEALEEKLITKLGVIANIKVISQKDEGIYAFEGAVEKAKLDKEKVIAWDIGGGSMQLTGKEGEEYQVLGGTVASSTFKTKVVELLGRSENESIYPISRKEVEQIIDLGNEQVGFDTAQEEWLHQRKEKNNEIVGAGNIHDSLLRLMKHNGIVKSTVHNYTDQDLEGLIDLFTDKDAEQIKSLLTDRDQAFSENILTNMLLVRATMEKYGIDTVRVIEVSNTDTIIKKAVDMNLSAITPEVSKISSIETVQPFGVGQDYLQSSSPQIGSASSLSGNIEQKVSGFNLQNLVQAATIGIKFLQYLLPRKFGHREAAPVIIELDDKVKVVLEREEEKKRLDEFNRKFMTQAQDKLEFVRIEDIESTREYQEASQKLHQSIENPDVKASTVATKPLSRKIQR